LITNSSNKAVVADRVGDGDDLGVRRHFAG
jgi:hypothetical protein